MSRYLTGVAILSFALVLSGFLGIVQDYIYSKYTRAQPTPSRTSEITESHGKEHIPELWEESMFYMHFLSLPTFAFVFRDMSSQATTLFTASNAQQSLPIPSPFINLSPVSEKSKPSLPHSTQQLHIPGAVLFLILNATTQLFCSSGVNRLASRVSSLTVTLVLVVRKAVSLVLSIAFFSRGTHMSGSQWSMFSIGAAMVFTGTIVYASSKQPPRIDKTKED